VECADECVDTSTSLEHCGACDNACPLDAECLEGVCTCPGEEEDCDGVCTDTQTTYEHCGVCNNTCVNNQICVDGSCDCESSLSDCSDVCVDLSSDAANCGSCGNACLAEESCISGSCTCPAGLSNCDGVCVDLAWDPAHCGGCNAACPSGDFCTAGECLSSPCENLCNSPETVSEGAEGFRVDDLGTDARCFEVWGYAPTETNARIVCWEFWDGRSLRVNGMDAQCVADEGYALGDQRGGGYCVEVGAGDADFAGFMLPNE
jgi:hypothetical protein